VHRDPGIDAVRPIAQHGRRDAEDRERQEPTQEAVRESEDRGEGFYRSERSYGRFLRTIPLPDGVDAEKIEATFKDGVLEVTLPAPKGEQKRGRKISIR
jgi:HSP20 family molecular chaperone IbpA